MAFERWYAVENDAVGGWAIANEPLTVQQIITRRESMGQNHVRVIAEFVTEEEAQQVVDEHAAVSEVMRLIDNFRDQVDTLGDLKTPVGARNYPLHQHTKFKEVQATIDKICSALRGESE